MKKKLRRDLEDENLYCVIDGEGNELGLFWEHDTLTDDYSEESGLNDEVDYPEERREA